MIMTGADYGGGGGGWMQALPVSPPSGGLHHVHWRNHSLCLNKVACSQIGRGPVSHPTMHLKIKII